MLHLNQGAENFTNYFCSAGHDNPSYQVKLICDENDSLYMYTIFMQRNNALIFIFLKICHLSMDLWLFNVSRVHIQDVTLT